MDLPSLKFAIDKIGMDQLKTVSTNLRKLSDVVDNDVVKETVYDELE